MHSAFGSQASDVRTAICFVHPARLTAKRLASGMFLKFIQKKLYSLVKDKTWKIFFKIIKIEIWNLTLLCLKSLSVFEHVPLTEDKNMFNLRHVMECWRKKTCKHVRVMLKNSLVSEHVQDISKCLENYLTFKKFWQTCWSFLPLMGSIGPHKFI